MLSSENISQCNHDTPHFKKESYKIDSSDSLSPTPQPNPVRTTSPSEYVFPSPSFAPQVHPAHPSLFSANSNSNTSPISASIPPATKTLEQLFQDYLLKQLSSASTDASISIEEEFEYFRRFRLNNTKLVNTVS